MCPLSIGLYIGAVAAGAADSTALVAVSGSLVSTSGSTNRTTCSLLGVEKHSLVGLGRRKLPVHGSGEGVARDGVSTKLTGRLGLAGRGDGVGTGVVCAEFVTLAFDSASERGRRADLRNGSVCLWPGAC
jgi:hypothetical protein